MTFRSAREHGLFLLIVVGVALLPIPLAVIAALIVFLVVLAYGPDVGRWWLRRQER